MATATRSISPVGEVSTPEIQSCLVSRSMLLSAFSENVSLTVDVITRAAIGALAFWLVGVSLPLSPGLEFYAALSASVGMLYFANLSDVKGVRDAIVTVVPAAMGWGILWFHVNNTALVGITLFTHLLVAFFAGFSKVSGSLKDLALWPVLFGGMSVTLAGFIEQFLF